MSHGDIGTPAPQRQPAGIVDCLRALWAHVAQDVTIRCSANPPAPGVKAVCFPGKARRAEA